MFKERMIMIIIVNPTIEPNSYIIQYLSNSSYDHHQYTRELTDVSYNTIIIGLRIINKMFSTTQHHARQDQTGSSKLTSFMGIYNSSIPPRIQEQYLQISYYMCMLICQKLCKCPERTQILIRYHVRPVMQSLQNNNI